MMLHNNYPASEAHYMCDVCSEAITNPLCPECLTMEIEAWLTLYPNLRSELLPKIQQFLNEIEDKLIHDTTQCIKCGEKKTAICPYCFTDFVLKHLKKINANKIVLTEFFEFFNFDLDHKGYSKEAEELGVI